MKRQAFVLLLCSTFAVTSYASDYKSGWNYINFYESIQDCRESIVYPQVEAYEKKGIQAKQNKTTLKNEMISITPIMDKLATDSCFCVINEIAKDNTFEKFKNGVNFESYMQIPHCEKIFENSLNSLKNGAAESRLK